MSVITALMNSGRTPSFEAAFRVKDITSSDMQAAIREWFNLYYANETPEDEDPCQRLPVVIVNKLTKTVFSEYTATPAKGKTGNPFLSAVLEGLENSKKKAMQQALIGGVSWLKPIFHKDGAVHFAVVSRNNALILSRDDMDRVSSIGTAERTLQDKNTYTLLERRTVDANGYLTIENKLFFSTTEGTLGVEVPLGRLDRYADLLPRYTYRDPLHSLGLIPVRVPLENCVDGEPDPVSVYAPAVGLIHNINRNEAQINGEFDRGKSRVFVSADLMTRDKKGKLRFEDDVFTALDDEPDTVGVTIFSPALRESSFLARKAEYLRNMETVIGMKRGLLSEVEASERTAKEITSSEGDYNLTIIDFQEMWETAAREAVRVCCALGRLYGIYHGPEIDPNADVAISWGNGILYDEDKVWSELKEMVAAGLLKAEIAVGWYFDMPTDTPEDLQRIREKYMPEVENLLNGDDE